MTARKEDEILIEWGAVSNIAGYRGGWMPVVWVNGRLYGDTYGRGYDRDKAEQIAQAEALEQGSKYIGDWKVIITPR